MDHAIALGILGIEHWIKDRVVVDNDPGIIGVVTSIEIRSAGVVRYEVSWLHNGEAKYCMFDPWRLSTL